MRVLFVTKPHLPLVGGTQVTEHHLALALRDRGHAVTVLCRADPVRRPVHGREGIDHSPGYPTIKRADVPATLRRGLRALAPDVVVVAANSEGVSGGADAVLAELVGVPKVLYLHDAPAAALATRPVDRVLAVSGFIADAASRASSVEVVPPIVDTRRYSVRTTRRTALLVNPVPAKGVAIGLELAALHPDVPFAFTRCWWIPPRTLASLRAEARRLGNVELRDAVTDPAALYGDARVLLVPSTRPEGWGRVVREAQCSGIPVIAARVGGLPEAVGRGGVLVDPDAGVAGWSAALSRLWADAREYGRLSALARDQAASEECAPGRVAARFEAIFEEISAGAASLAG